MGNIKCRTLYILKCCIDLLSTSRHTQNKVGQWFPTYGPWCYFRGDCRYTFCRLIKQYCNILHMYYCFFRCFCFFLLWMNANYLQLLLSPWQLLLLSIPPINRAKKCNCKHAKFSKILLNLGTYLHTQKVGNHWHSPWAPPHSWHCAVY